MEYLEELSYQLSSMGVSGWWFATSGPEQFTVTESTQTPLFTEVLSLMRVRLSDTVNVKHTVGLIAKAWLKQQQDNDLHKFTTEWPKKESIKATQWASHGCSGDHNRAVQYQTPANLSKPTQPCLEVWIKFLQNHLRDIIHHNIVYKIHLYVLIMCCVYLLLKGVHKGGAIEVFTSLLWFFTHCFCRFGLVFAKYITFRMIYYVISFKVVCLYLTLRPQRNELLRFLCPDMWKPWKKLHFFTWLDSI